MASTFPQTAKLVGLSLALLLSSCGARAQATPQGGDFSENAHPQPLPAGEILVKGAWSSASDTVTPLPEGGTLAENIYSNKYFGLTYALAQAWTQKFTGPPPSDSGYYVLAQLGPADASKAASRASILLAAQDLFFTLAPATNAFELIHYTKEKLRPDYTVERDPTPVTIAGRSFVRFDYFSPVAGLHWYVLATQIRCHMVQFVFTSRDTKALESLIQGLDKMTLPAEASPILGSGGGDVPVCIKDYARPENVLQRIDPVFTERRFNPIPVRVIIDKNGQVKHIHFLSAFPDQAKGITDALMQWRFKPYLRDGQPAEVETGILFGRAPRIPAASRAAAVNE